VNVNYALPNKDYMPYTLISFKQKYPDEEAVSGTIKNEMTQKRNSEKNKSEFYDIAVYIGILSFLWAMPCQPVRIWLVRYFFGHTLFNFLDFDWEVYYGVRSTVQDLAK